MFTTGRTWIEPQARKTFFSFFFAFNTLLVFNWNKTMFVFVLFWWRLTKIFCFFQILSQFLNTYFLYFICKTANNCKHLIWLWCICKKLNKRFFVVYITDFNLRWGLFAIAGWINACRLAYISHFSLLVPFHCLSAVDLESNRSSFPSYTARCFLPLGGGRPETLFVCSLLPPPCFSQIWKTNSWSRRLLNTPLKIPHTAAFLFHPCSLSLCPVFWTVCLQIRYGERAISFAFPWGLRDLIKRRVVFLFCWYGCGWIILWVFGN